MEDLDKLAGYRYNKDMETMPTNKTFAERIQRQGWLVVGYAHTNPLEVALV